MDADPGRGIPVDLGPGIPDLCGDIVRAGDRVLSGPEAEGGDNVLPGEACRAAAALLAILPPGLEVAGLELVRDPRPGDVFLAPPWNTDSPLFPNDLDRLGKLLLCTSVNI